MKLPFVSVIIPIYNTGQYLERCLDSVCSQTLHDIEIICINDGSTDSTQEIVEYYANKDKRIHIIKNYYNNGAASARNIGLLVASGKYIGFVDSDDAIDKNFYKTLYSKANNIDADFVKGQRVDIDPRGKKFFSDINHKICIDKFNYTFQFTTSIYKSDIIKKFCIDFPKGSIINEDIAFLQKFIMVSKIFYILDDAYYIRYIRKNSISDIQSENQCEKVLSSFNAAYDILNFAKKIKIKEEEYKKIFFTTFIRCYNNICSILQKNENLYRMFSKELIVLYNNFYDDKYILDNYISNFDLSSLRFIQNNDAVGLAKNLLNFTKYQRCASSFREKIISKHNR